MGVLAVVVVDELFCLFAVVVAAVFSTPSRTALVKIKHSSNFPWALCKELYTPKKTRRLLAASWFLGRSNSGFGSGFQERFGSFCWCAWLFVCVKSEESWSRFPPFDKMLRWRSVRWCWNKCCIGVRGVGTSSGGFVEAVVAVCLPWWYWFCIGGAGTRVGGTGSFVVGW